MMGRFLRILWQAVLSTFSAPTQDLVRSALVLALGLVLLLLVVVAMITVLEPGRRKVVKVRRYRVRPNEVSPDTAVDTGEVAQQPDETVSAGEVAQQPDDTVAAGEAKVLRWRIPPSVARLMGTWGVAVLVIVALLSGYYITGTNAYCADTCHAGQDVITKASKLDHASCVACHEQQGLSAIPANVLQRTSMIAGRVLGSTPSGVIVDSRACTRCHRKDILKTTTASSGLKMSHVEVDSAGRTCTSCHAGVGHSRVRAYSMSSCIVCHDGTKASADCTTCHTREPLAKAVSESAATFGSGRVVYGLVDVRPSCDGCHDQVKQCDSCHGLRMPHSDAFLNGGHAPIAAFDGKTKCWKCHYQGECTRCHVSFPAHWADWKTAHAKEPWNAPCPCHTQRTGKPTCWECHSPQPPHALLK